MIVAKTRMRKIPKSCKECGFSFNDWSGERVCMVKKKDCPIEYMESGQWRYGKPAWCPLVEMEDTHEK